MVEGINAFRNTLKVRMKCEDMLSWHDTEERLRRLGADEIWPRGKCLIAMFKDHWEAARVKELILNAKLQNEAEWRELDVLAKRHTQKSLYKNVQMPTRTPADVRASGTDMRSMLRPRSPTDQSWKQVF